MLPTDAQVIGRSDFCANAVLSYGNHILTFQPHPEFDASFTKGLIDHRGQGVVPDDLLNSAKSRCKSRLHNPKWPKNRASFPTRKEDVMSNDLETFLSSLPQHAQDYLTGRKLDEVECVIADLPALRAARRACSKIRPPRFVSSARSDILPNNHRRLGRSRRCGRVY